ncbi:hypothetical protein GCM10010149_56970 [Nonomuraea roseoviolacea subsp. roseoviolacea]
MRISARTQYALRAAAELAAAPPGPVPAERIAAAQGIPRKFLDNILLQLRRAGLLHSQRGPDGGYWLAYPKEQISLADIITVVEGVPEGGDHGGYPGVARPLADVWSALRDHEETLLSEITLAHVAEGTLPPPHDHPRPTPPVGSSPPDGSSPEDGSSRPDGSSQEGGSSSPLDRSSPLVRSSPLDRSSPSEESSPRDRPTSPSDGAGARLAARPG